MEIRQILHSQTTLNVKNDWEEGSAYCADKQSSTNQSTSIPVAAWINPFGRQCT